MSGWRGAWGETAYGKLWRPMLEGKFGPHFQDVNLAWFWARVYKRTPRLGYYRGRLSGLRGQAGRSRAKAGCDNRNRYAPVRSLTSLPEGGFRIEIGEKAEHGGGPAGFSQF